MNERGSQEAKRRRSEQVEASETKMRRSKEEMCGEWYMGEERVRREGVCEGGRKRRDGGGGEGREGGGRGGGMGEGRECGCVAVERRVGMKSLITQVSKKKNLCGLLFTVPTQGHWACRGRAWGRHDTFDDPGIQKKTYAGSRLQRQLRCTGRARWSVGGRYEIVDSPRVRIEPHVGVLTLPTLVCWAWSVRTGS
jgi:hypothetical protein